MESITNPIIPIEPTYIGFQGELDYEAICVFMALGFFLDQDTYYKDHKVLKPGYQYVLNNANEIVKSEPSFKWHYEPHEKPLKQLVDDFGDLFETIVREQAHEKSVILPLSGGLDSRTLAVALHHTNARVNAYSYRFDGGLDETFYSKKIAQACNFPFTEFLVKAGYLWPVIERLSKLNACYAEFTHARQMAFLDQYEAMGDVFGLGHGGDLLFDDMGVPEDLSFEQQVDEVQKKVLKRGGLQLATDLWIAWGLKGDFKDYLYERIKTLVRNIDIPHSANARIRAFKSLYWVPRWTNANLSVFSSVRPITLPYYDNRMCEFICTVPERYLADRQIQIEYIKMRAPKLARITWQGHRPFNLYSYRMNRAPFNVPYRVYDKLKRVVSTKKFIQRNWELQFLGEQNNNQLKKWLFEQPVGTNIVPEKVIRAYYDKFIANDPVLYAHPVSMLLTLSLFSKQRTK